MDTDIFPQDLYLPPHALLGNPERTPASYEQELKAHQEMEARLQEMLAKSEALLRQKDEAIEYQTLMRRESDHRLLNDMQMVVSLLALESRAAGQAETAVQLIKAASRVSMIAGIHRRLHSIEGIQMVAFRQYLAAFCREFSAMLSPKAELERISFADGPEITLPSGTAVPLAFIISELLTNAVKHGEGLIAIRLETIPGQEGHLLSVSNDGPALPATFDPATSQGLGMKIIQTFLRKIGGQLQCGPASADRGACFTVLFR